MNGKPVIWIVAVVLVVVGAAYWMISNRSADSMTGYGAATPTPADTAQIVQTGTSSVSTALEKTYMMADVATHTGKESCWSVIDGKVYDLTSWIGKHPGGERAVLSLCGKDGSEAFHGQHAYNQTQAEILVGFKIGALGQ